MTRTWIEELSGEFEEGPYKGASNTQLGVFHTHSGVCKTLGSVSNTDLGVFNTRTWIEELSGEFEEGPVRGGEG